MQTTAGEAGSQEGAISVSADGAGTGPVNSGFRLIADNSLSLVIVADHAGMVQYVNPVFCEATGFSPAEVIGRRVHDLGAIEPATLVDLWNTVGFGKPWRGEFAARTRKGRELWLYSSVSPITDSDGNVTHFIAVNIDITKRKRAERALAESEGMFRTLVDSMPAAVVIFQGDHVSYANRICFDVLGYSPEDLPRLNYWDAIHEDYRDLVRKRGSARLRGEDVPNNYELQFLKKDGEVRWGIYSGAAVTYHGKPAVLGIISDITDRKHADEALRESEERFRKLAETTAAATFIFEGAHVRYANGAAASVTGYSVAELTGKNFWEIAHPDIASLTRERIQATPPGQPIPLRAEVGVVTKDGQTRWLDLNMGFVEIGGKELVLGTGFDITERREIEQALRDSEEKFRSIVETSTEIVWAIDGDLRVTYVNPTVERILGYTPGELMGDYSMDFLHPDDLENTLAWLRDAASAAKGWPTIVNRWLCKDGTWRYIETGGVPIVDDQGTVSGFRGVARDVTDRNLAEEGLRRSEERYRLLYQDNPSMYFTLSEDLSVQSVNRHGAEQLGYGAEELIGGPVLTVVHADDQIHVRRQLESLLKNRGAKHGLEFRKVRKDGTVMWVKESVRVTHDTDGERIILVVCEDITERRQMEEAVQGLREELERKAERAVEGQNPYGLTFRELTVLHLVTGGRSDKEIGVVLGIRPQTVSKHVANVLKKMKASSRTQAGVRALREGLIS